MLIEANALKLYKDLKVMAEMIDEFGWSRYEAIDTDGSISLHGALGLLCGVRPEDLSDDFDSMLAAAPDMYARRLCALWDLLEAAIGTDVVLANLQWEMSEQVVLFLNDLANLVEIG